MTSLLRSDAKFCPEFFIHLLIIVPIDSCSHRTVTVDEHIPIALALLMGLQHAFAMIGGLITPSLVVIKFAVCGASVLSRTGAVCYLSITDCIRYNQPYPSISISHPVCRTYIRPKDVSW